MLYKPAKSRIGKGTRNGIKAVLVAECILFISSFSAWQLLRHSRGSRLFCREHCPYILDKYYAFEEYTSPELKSKITDQMVWEHNQKLAK